LGFAEAEEEGKLECDCGWSKGEWEGVLRSEIVVGEDSATGEEEGGACPFHPKNEVNLFEVTEMPCLAAPFACAAGSGPRLSGAGAGPVRCGMVADRFTPPEGFLFGFSTGGLCAGSLPLRPWLSLEGGEEENLSRLRMGSRACSAGGSAKEEVCAAGL
jgi:hypothetical protein